MRAVRGIALGTLLLSGCGRVSFVPRDAFPPEDASTARDGGLLDARDLVDATDPDAARPGTDAASPMDAPSSTDARAADAASGPDAASIPDAASLDAASGGARITSIAVETSNFGADPSFSCALQSDGRVACWGGNTRGQLGDGSGVDQLRPVAVVGLDDAVLLGTGSEHACALRATGTLVCWGANDRGQLGNGGATDEPLATPVTATSGAGVVAIAGNATSSCVLRSTGAVDCWGERSWSAGGGTAASAERVWSAGIRSIEGAGFGLHAISASDVLTYVGGAGWGYPYEPGPSTVWADVAGVTPLDAIDVAQGWDHSCAVVRDGTIRCFGRDEGKSGDGSPSDMQHNPPVVTLGVSGATAIAAGSGHTCALLASGAVSCWGSNSSGELGDGGPSGSSRLATSVATLSDATEIDAGWVHTCALRSDGSVWCWGGNNHGQLGTGDLGVRTTPAPVVGLPLP